MSPLFASEIWNVHETTSLECDRTNNQTDGFNNRFSNEVGNIHLTV